MKHFVKVVMALLALMALPEKVLAVGVNSITMTIDKAQPRLFSKVRITMEFSEEVFMRPNRYTLDNVLKVNGKYMDFIMYKKSPKVFYFLSAHQLSTVSDNYYYQLSMIWSDMYTAAKGVLRTGSSNGSEASLSLTSEARAQLNNIVLPATNKVYYLNAKVMGFEYSVNELENSKEAQIKVTFDKNLIYIGSLEDLTNSGIPANTMKGDYGVKRNGNIVQVMGSVKSYPTNEFFLHYPIQLEEEVGGINRVTLSEKIASFFKNFSGFITAEASVQFDVMFEENERVVAYENIKKHKKAAVDALSEASLPGRTLDSLHASLQIAKKALADSKTALLDISSNDSRYQESSASVNLITENTKKINDKFKPKYQTDENTIKGYWKNPVIKGLAFITSKYGYTGMTNDKGEYLCQKDEGVIFSLGIIRVLKTTCNSDKAPNITLIQSLTPHAIRRP
ncbi:hypothetical protein [Bathymodiolus thermophilus thioautotrophic gill symbiont]|uniref:Uncharacterized protein n=1 Tax=Bathymodiolus thermophilus thioautotrophic gill symbiont TaxID=2360 RepID=A0A1J5TUN0_9GAMM|nr:hypothetical protein [Bathymodiolus thermophilus thioautotrophic gill symbiont]OIR23876.1 hypothetical protein BGC33_08420 [Bathymodiolus thermophilus thioautotrophic gill symbiont]